MLLLVHSAHETLAREHPERNVARLLSPRQYSRVADTVRGGFLWAADNDAYSGFDEERYLIMLDTIEGVPGCLFVTAPDIVGDAKETRRLFEVWWHALKVRRLPIGYVAQDGATDFDLPWSRISALFIGGTTEWKMSENAAVLAVEAKMRGLWVHMGRVNTQRRIKYAKSIGCDSIDGTSMSMYRRTYVPRFSEYADAPTQGRFE